MSLHNLSIKRKLTLMAMLTSSIALVLSAASFFIYDLTSFRTLLGQDLATQAEIIGYNSAAAMAFKDEASATVTLSALKAKRDVTAAILYSPSGAIFARYFRDDAQSASLPVRPKAIGSRIEGSRAEVFESVTLNGEPVGTLFLQSDMSQWNTRAKRYASILGIIVLVSGFFAWLVSSRLQLLISRPILHLEDTMRMVSVGKDYGVRAKKFYGDEIGRLIEGFNTMLSEIQHRDMALQRANDELQARTGELEQEVFHRNRTQEELLRAKEVAEDASRAKSIFLANMSHELRTPLNAIIGYSEMLEEDMRDTGKAETIQDLQKIQSAGKHLLSLINDVLDLSKIEAGKMGLHLENFDVAPMIREMVATLEPAAAKNANTIQVHLTNKVGAMMGDITKVRQILYNLMSNACKFTDHGIVSLDVERSTAEGQDWIRFQVSDTGIGIAPDQSAKLFQEFAQADASISRKYGGTGLGLAISHRFVQLMKGHIGVESEPGKGSTFTVHLPAEIVADVPEVQQQNAPSEVPAEAPEIKPGMDTILVIDDDPAVRDLMSRTLTKMGFHAIVATNGEEGLRLAKQVHPMTITLDVIMPGMNGWLVLHELKADPGLTDIPVIMATVVDNEVMGLDLGASGYLIKPIERDRLAVLLEKYRSTRISAVNEVNSPTVSQTPNAQQDRADIGTGETKGKSNGQDSHSRRQ